MFESPSTLRTQISGLNIHYFKGLEQTLARYTTLNPARSSRLPEDQGAHLLAPGKRLRIHRYRLDPRGIQAPVHEIGPRSGRRAVQPNHGDYPHALVANHEIEIVLRRTPGLLRREGILGRLDHRSEADPRKYLMIGQRGLQQVVHQGFRLAQKPL